MVQEFTVLLRVIYVEKRNIFARDFYSSTSIIKGSSRQHVTYTISILEHCKAAKRKALSEWLNALNSN